MLNIKGLFSKYILVNKKLKSIENFNKGEFPEYSIANPGRYDEIKNYLKFNSFPLYLTSSERRDFDRICSNYKIKKIQHDHTTSDLIIAKTAKNTSNIDEEDEVQNKISKIKYFIIPFSSEITQLIKNSHELTNHGGIESTYYHLKERSVFWRKMLRDIQKTILECTTCQCTEKPLKITKKVKMISQAPNDFWFIDLIDIRNLQECKYNWILTLKDHLSKKMYSFPLINKEGTTVGKVLEEFFKNILPRNLWSDNGTEFKNELIQNLLNKINAMPVYGKAYHPNQQGVVENSHSGLVRYLNKCLAESKLKNEKFNINNIINEYTMNYNNKRHHVTKFSPNYVFNCMDVNIFRECGRNMINYHVNLYDAIIFIVATIPGMSTVNYLKEKMKEDDITTETKTFIKIKCDEILNWNHIDNQEIEHENYIIEEMLSNCIFDEYKKLNESEEDNESDTEPKLNKFKEDDDDQSDTDPKIEVYIIIT
jgi:hypothetical protein